MPSPFDQDNQPSVPPTSEWPTQPGWPAPPQHASYAPPTTPTHTAPASVWQPPPAAPPVWQAQAAGPPMSPPPVPPTTAYPQAPGSPAPRRSGWTSSGSRLGLAVAVALALLVGAAGGGVAARSVLTTSVDTATAPPVTSGSGSGSGSGGTTATVPEESSSGSGSSSGSNGSTSELTNLDDVVAKVTVGVVNIESRMAQGVGAGTGMVLTSDGQILTNNHVVEGASQIVVTVVTTGESYRASIVGTDPDDDVAVLQLTGASDLETIPLGDSDDVRVGDDVVAIGNAGGDGGEPDVAQGQVTALDQQITASDDDGTNAETLTDMIEVAADIVPGDSGGPLADANGEVIGMNTAASVSGAGSTGRFGGPMQSQSTTTTGEGYAIPINKALSIAEELEQTRANGGSTSGTSTSGGYLGVQVQEGTDGGAEIVGVQTGSPAAEAGLAAGATIVGLDRTEITSPDALVSALSDHDAGDEVTITWLGTDGRTHQSTVTLASR